eukprot:c22560_g2_i1 orf=45-308(+)
MLNTIRKNTHTHGEATFSKGKMPKTTWAISLSLSLHINIYLIVLKGTRGLGFVIHRGNHMHSFLIFSQSSEESGGHHGFLEGSWGGG